MRWKFLADRTRMRFFVAIAILASGIAGATPARTADLRAAIRSHYPQFSPSGRRAAPLLVYAYEPGVTMRAYWRRPWCNHHYFPFGHDRWDRRRAQAYVRPKPAQSFHQYWSTSQAFLRESPLFDGRRPIIEK
jgi:hypothetical protein